MKSPYDQDILQLQYAQDHKTRSSLDVESRKHCFCSKCQTELSKSQKTHDNLSEHKTLLCQSCYGHVLTKSSCKSCRLTVLDPAISSRGEYWHKKCFRCTTCGADISTRPQVDLSNFPQCQACFEASPDVHQISGQKSSLRPCARSRSSLELHKRTSFTGRLKGQSSASFEDLMNKIKLNDHHKPYKSDTQKKQTLGPCIFKTNTVASTGSISPMIAHNGGTEQTAWASPVPMNLSSADQYSSTSLCQGKGSSKTCFEEHIPSGTFATSATSESIRHRTTEQDSSSKLSLISDTSPMRLPPPLDVTPNLCRRRSTPRAWRVPSTTFEAEEDLEHNIVSDNDGAIAKDIVNKPHETDTTSRFQQGLVAQTPATSITKSCSSGHLPGLFAQRPGRPVNLHLGGTKRCAGCLKAVFPLEEVLGPASTKFHRSCLRCAGCRKQMDSSSKLTTRNPDSGNIQVYCRTCWDTRFRSSSLRKHG